MAQWKVKDGTQVNYGDKLYVGGETFSASEEEVVADGIGSYVEKAERKTAEKAQQSSANKATQPESNKAQAPSKSGK